MDFKLQQDCEVNGGTPFAEARGWAAAKEQNCPRCCNNRQVWTNQLTGRKTCHRAWCYTEIEPPNAAHERPATSDQR